jgi:hypothetical protein
LSIESQSRPYRQCRSILPQCLSAINEFAGLIFTNGDGRDRGAGGRSNANGAGISAGAVGL